MSNNKLVFLIVLCLFSGNLYAVNPARLLEEAIEYFSQASKTKILTNNIDEVIELSNKWPKSFDTISGKITFNNPHEMGRLGDWFTNLRLTSSFHKLPAKYNNLHGIDGLFVKPSIENPAIIIVAENKINMSQLYSGPPKQMSGEWVLDRLRKLASSDHEQTATIGAKVLKLYETQPEIFIKQVWRHDLSSGKTTVTEIDEAGNIITSGTTNKIFKNDLIARKIEHRCKIQTLICE